MRMRPLDPAADRQRIADNIGLVKKVFPEMVGNVRDLHAAGLIDGWRNLAWVGPSGVPVPGFESAVEPVLSSPAEQATLERMRSKR